MDGNVALSLPISGTPFAANSFWNTPLPSSTPTNPNNGAYDNDIAYDLCNYFATNGCNSGGLNFDKFSIPLYVVPANQPHVAVNAVCANPKVGTGFTPPPSLEQDVLAGEVPVPADAHAATGTDEDIVIYQPSTNTEWELWQFEKGSSGAWQACDAGVIPNVSQSDGIFPKPYGLSASGLSKLASTPRIDELQAGQIDHPIGLTLPIRLDKDVLPANTPGATAGFSWPANRTDGTSTNPLEIAEGQRFRLPANLNLAQYDLTPVAMTIAEAAQKYGLIVVDGAGSVAIQLGDSAPYVAAGLPDPYTSGTGVGGVNNGNQGLFGGVPAYAIMKNFPWSQLQALPFNYGEPSTAPPTVAMAAPPSNAIVSGTTTVSATATDSVGITNVQFELDGKPLGAAVTTPTPSTGSTYTYSWNTTTGVANGTHTLTAIATDTDGNIATATSVSVTVRNADTTPPSTPTGLTAQAPTSAAVNLSWQPSTDNVGVTQYKLYRNGSATALATLTIPSGSKTPPTTYTDATVSANTTYSYTVSALDAAGNQSAHSVSVKVTTPASPDKTPPTVPTKLSGSATSQTSIALSWTPSTDTGGSGLAGYHVYQYNQLVASVTAPTTTYIATGLMPGTRYTYRVSAYDGAANGSAASKAVSITTEGTSPDKTPPTAPANLHSIQKDKTETSIMLSWSPSSDSGGAGLAGYQLYRGGALIASPTTTTYTDSGLSVGTTYHYYVKAYDNAGNVSSSRRTIAVTTRHHWWELWDLGE
jgi:fibronectin type 3 domain-containing protein